MILTVSEIPTKVTTPFPRGNGSNQKQQRQQQHGSSSSLSLRTLVDLASTLFDQTTREDGNLKQEDQKRQSHQGITGKDEPHRQLLAPGLNSKSSKREFPPVSLVNSELIVRKATKRTGIPIMNETNFQCCTREGFLSRLRSVLNDPSKSHVLSWMPDGKAFTIVSSREFAKTGMVYDLFGIRKMSSFLRRLNQLGFARVRDPTDPKNLDVFRKPGFVAASTAATDVIQTKNTGNASLKDIANKEVQRSPSPTSTLLFAPTVTSVDNETDEDIEVTSSTSARNMRDSKEPSSSSPSSTWVCSTPESAKLPQSQPLGLCNLPSVPPEIPGVKSSNHRPLSMDSIPPSMPASSIGGPVLLRARSESYDGSYDEPVSSPPTATLALQHPHNLLIPPSVAISNTPRSANRRPLILSPGTLRILEIPNLEHVSQGENSLANASIRPPPLNFVAECVRHLIDHPLQQPVPMDIVPTEGPQEEYRQTVHDSDGRIVEDNFQILGLPKSLGVTQIHQFPKMRHEREYLALCRAADSEADAILSCKSTRSKATEQEHNPPSERTAQKARESHLLCEASVLADVELLQGHWGGAKKVSRE